MKRARTLGSAPRRRACSRARAGRAPSTSCSAEIDALSETADERAEAILGALYEYAEAIAPEA
jgi:hypothetical protein